MLHFFHQSIVFLLYFAVHYWSSMSPIFLIFHSSGDISSRPTDLLFWMLLRTMSCSSCVNCPVWYLSFQRFYNTFALYKNLSIFINSCISTPAFELYENSHIFYVWNISNTSSLNIYIYIYKCKSLLLTDNLQFYTTNCFKIFWEYFIWIQECSYILII